MSNKAIDQKNHTTNSSNGIWMKGMSDEYIEDLHIAPGVPLNFNVLPRETPNNIELVYEFNYTKMYCSPNKKNYGVGGRR